MAFSDLTGIIQGLLIKIMGLPGKLGTKLSQCAAVIRRFFTALAEAFRGGPGRGHDASAGSSVRINSLKEAFLGIFKPGRFSVDKKRPLLLGLGGLAALVLILLITVLALNSGKTRKGSAVDLASGPLIPADELFIPTEPDFLPEFLLERNPRHFWSLDDINQYWKGPGNPARWRADVTEAVDKLMAGVP